MSQPTPDKWRDCPKCKGAGRIPGPTGQTRCKACDGEGMVPR